MKDLPIEYKKRMKTLLGDEYESYEKALLEPPVRAFRVNTDKISLDEFEKINVFSSEKIPYVENGFYLNYDKIGNHPYHHAGMIYVQEPAAMAPAECIDINPDWKILDMCAAPGGKSTQLKNKLGENGLLVSNEIIPSRCKILTGNIERLGLNNVVTTCMDTGRLAKTFPKTFDMIILDPPKFAETEAQAMKAARGYKDINLLAMKLLNPGGKLFTFSCSGAMTDDLFRKVVDSAAADAGIHIVPTTGRLFHVIPEVLRKSGFVRYGICFLLDSLSDSNCLLCAFLRLITLKRYSAELVYLLLNRRLSKTCFGLG